MAGNTLPQHSQENVNREDQFPLEMEEENGNRGLGDEVFGGTNRDHPVFSGNSTSGSDTVKEPSMRKLSEKPSQASLTSEHSFTDQTSTVVVLEPTKTTAKGRQAGLDGTDVPTATVMIRRLAVDQDTADRPHKCRQCSRAFKKASNLRSHEETHSGLKLHVCELCGKAYSHHGTLQQHRRLHTGERPYRCPFCSRTYVWSSDFCKHVRTHTGEKPYACSECGKAFLRPSDLRKHERNMHANDRPLPCPQCGKTFNKPLSLLRHQRSHLGERPFRCPDCGKDFAVASRMVEHQKVHIGLRPYACDICSKAFTRASNLAEHRTLHSGLRPHKCPSAAWPLPCPRDLPATSSCTLPANPPGRTFQNTSRISWETAYFTLAGGSLSYPPQVHFWGSRGNTTPLVNCPSLRLQNPAFPVDVGSLTSHITTLYAHVSISHAFFTELNRNLPSDASSCRPKSLPAAFAKCIC